MVLGRSSARRRSARMRDRQMAAAVADAREENGSSEQQQPAPVGSRPPSYPLSRRGRRRGAGDGKNVWVKLGFKMVTYGVVMLLLRYNKKGGGEKELPTFLRWLEPLLNSGRGRGASDETALAGVRTIRAGTGYGPDAKQQGRVESVYVKVVPDFVPADVAKRWRDGAAYEWDRGTDGSSAFALASFPPSSIGLDVGNRNRTAHAAREAGRESMVRWELEGGHPLTAEVRRTLGGSDLRRRVGSVLGNAARSDWEAMAVIKGMTAVMNYAVGDFLYDYSGLGFETLGGGGAGEWHVIHSLSAARLAKDDGAGGREGEEFERDDAPATLTVRFGCPPPLPDADNSGGDDESDSESSATQSSQSKAGDWCERVELKFNEAILFATDSGARAGYGRMPRYEVMPLDSNDWVNGYRNYVVAGSWYRVLDEGDEKLDQATATEQRQGQEL